MTDAEIIKLYFDRSERAIEETDRVYGRYCRNISFEILRNIQDSEEIVNDAYLKTWDSIPPKDPPSLKNFLAKIVRSLSINRLDYNNAQKRGGGQLDAVLSELVHFNVEKNLPDIIKTRTKKLIFTHLGPSKIPAMQAAIDSFPYPVYIANDLDVFEV